MKPYLHASTVLLLLFSLSCSDRDDPIVHPGEIEQEEEGIDRLESLIGAYDVSGLNGYLGTVQIEGESIDICVIESSLATICVRGRLVDDVVELTGLRRSADTEVELRGTATVSKSGGKFRVHLSVDDGRQQSTYELSRDPSFDLAAFAGTWTWTFAQSPSGCDIETAARYELAFPAGGIGFAQVTTDAADGRSYGTIEPISALVTPTGRVVIFGTYRVSDEAENCSIYPARTYGLILLGRLQARDESGGSASGSGVAEVSWSPVFVDQTSWTATSARAMARGHHRVR